MRNAESLAVVALGGNLGVARANVRAAMARLAVFASTPPLRSSLWRSSPMGCPPGSPDFINAAVAFTPLPHFTPETLLTELQKLEREFGRQPKVVLNEARPLDLDLIAWGAEVRNTPTLILPHPRAHLRRFVLEPLCELAPNLVLPGQTKTVARLLAGLRSDEVIQRIS